MGLGFLNLLSLCRGKHLLDLHRDSNMGLRCKSKRCLLCTSSEAYSYASDYFANVARISPGYSMQFI